MADRLTRRIAAVGKLRRRVSTDPDREPEFAQALVQLADDLDAAGRRPEALDYLHEAEQLYRYRIQEVHPEELLLAGCLGREARWRADADPAAAERLYAEEDDLYLKVAHAAPARRLVKSAQILQMVMQQSLSAKSYRSAEGAARACLVLAHLLVSQDPAAERYLVNVRNSLVLSLAGQGRHPEAWSEAVRTVDLARAAAAEGRLSEKDLEMAIDPLKMLTGQRNASRDTH
jgi:tetratricopeptide (TPR) repeat protein